MAESPKTVPTDANVDAFLEQVAPARRRRDAERARDLFARVTGEEPVLWGPSIVGFGSVHYRYATGREGDWPPVAFSPRKAALTLYLMDGVEPHVDDLDELGAHTTGVGCLYVKDLEAVDMAVLERIVARSWANRGQNPRD
ncbi:DUF1801 domain-containing protein [Cellulomonas pakistanensis]|uniref:YdhG-like domain-containing protein n=1 Tax=Cellulomonas pakistanensis TaxID=992287 RepID=A0A919U4Q6_9CELL|nr:DUF1801 domain-containing protein [Cellulomonas pakistanensis]GIG37736.1 hypothetical protein Cpa01nite_31170 [Cellulomonas pakistanensis]